MKDLAFTTLSPEEARAFLTTVTDDIRPVTLPNEKTLVQVADLPFL